jgi:quinoprotein glucose dehydrogenase
LLIVGMSVTVRLKADTTIADQNAKPAATRTVWDGVYTEVQAERGSTSYLQACVSCHGEDLRGDGTAPSLVGESFAFLWGDMTVGELFVRTRKLMPPERPASLSAQSYSDIIAFILQKNTFPAGERDLDADPDALQQILITATRISR